MFKNRSTASGFSYAERDIPCEGCGIPRKLYYLNVDKKPVLLMTHGEEDAALVISAAKGRKVLRQLENFLTNEIPELATLELKRGKIEDGMTLALDHEGRAFLQFQDQDGTSTHVIIADRFIQLRSNEARIWVTGGDHRAIEPELRSWINENIGLAASRWEFVNEELQLIESHRDSLGAELFSNLETLDWEDQLEIVSQLQEAESTSERGRRAIASGERMQAMGAEMKARAISAISDPSVLQAPQLPDALAMMLEGMMKGGGVQIVHLGT